MRNSPDIVLACYPLENRTKQIWAFSELSGGDVEGTWQNYAHTHTYAETHQMGAVFWALMRLHSFGGLGHGRPPVLYSRPPLPRRVALFVIVIWPVFVKGSRTICSRWRVYTCTSVCVCVYRSQWVEGGRWHHCDSFWAIAREASVLNLNSCSSLL